MTQQKKRAFISVFDKTGLDDFARYLVNIGYEIVSTGGTAKQLLAADIPVTSVESLIGQGSLMDGRLKTLDMRIFGPILFDRDKPSHVEDLITLEQAPIDMVVVNLYPFEQMLAEGKSRDEMIEYIDIGGPSLLRAAAKNHRHVLVVTHPGHYRRVESLITQHGDAIPLSHREALAAEVFLLTSRYDRLIADHFITADDVAIPPSLTVQAPLNQPLRYGENPHQPAGFYLPEGKELPWQQLHGKALSFNNYADIDAARSMVAEFETPAVAIVKHANPCGFGLGESVTLAYQRALSTDPTSSFGGIVAFNRSVDMPTAELLSEMFLECIIAPDYDTEALDKLSKKKNLRLLQLSNNQEVEPWDIRSAAGGYLVQAADQPRSEDEWEIITERKPTAAEMGALRLGWKMVRFVKSNAIVLCNDTQLLGVGAGQMSRIDSVELSGMKSKQANLEISDAALASDAFFPFSDGVEVAAKLGVTAIIQPGGSIRDDEVIAEANKQGIAMVLTHSRHFRH